MSMVWKFKLRQEEERLQKNEAVNRVMHEGNRYGCMVGKGRERGRKNANGKKNETKRRYGVSGREVEVRAGRRKAAEERGNEQSNGTYGRRRSGEEWLLKKWSYR